MALKIKKPKGNSILSYIPDKSKYYAVRNENSIVKIRKWLEYAKKYNPSKQKFIVIDRINLFRSDKYWRMRHKGGHETRYNIYATY
jgi:hypothetical protein